MKQVLIAAIILAGLSTGCSQGPGYGATVSEQLGQVQNYGYGPQTTDISGPSNRVLSAAEYRSDIKADTAENHARAQHAELGVVDHRLDTARRAQLYDHLGHMDRNEEHRDDAYTIESVVGSISNTGANINSAIDNFRSIFK